MPETATFPVADALAEALETMAFVSLAPPEPPLAMPPEARLVRIEFRGPCQGWLELIAPRAFASTLAGNIMMSDEAVSDEQCDDALRELLNVTCGAMLARQTRACCSSCDMTIPRVAALGGEGEWQAFTSDPGAAVVDADGHLIAIRAGVQ